MKTSKKQIEIHYACFCKLYQTILSSSMPVATARRGMCFLLPAGKTDDVSAWLPAVLLTICPTAGKTACSFIVLLGFGTVEMNTPE